MIMVLPPRGNSRKIKVESIGLVWMRKLENYLI